MIYDVAFPNTLTKLAVVTLDDELMGIFDNADNAAEYARKVKNSKGNRYTKNLNLRCRYMKLDVLLEMVRQREKTSIENSKMWVSYANELPQMRRVIKDLVSMFVQNT